MICGAEVEDLSAANLCLAAYRRPKNPALPTKKPHPQMGLHSQIAVA